MQVNILLEVSHTQLAGHRIHINYWNGVHRWFAGCVTRFEVAQSQLVVHKEDENCLVIVLYCLLPQQAGPCRLNILLEVSHTQLVGHRIHVYWDGEHQWFAGRVTRFEVTCGQHVIRYDDGEVSRELLLPQMVRLERVASERPLPPPSWQQLQKLALALRGSNASAALRRQVCNYSSTARYDGSKPN